LRLPSCMSSGCASHADSASATAQAMVVRTMRGSESNRRNSETTKSNAIPTKIDKISHELDMPSAGVAVSLSSSTSFWLAGSISRQNSATTTDEAASNHGFAAPLRLTIAVRRMCSPRRAAMTAPSIASHRKRIVASSSVHTSELRNTQREKTPLVRMATSTTSTVAASGSVSAPIARSTRRSHGFRNPMTSSMNACFCRPARRSRAGEPSRSPKSTRP